jgi:polyisoprenoid-binding protein YceI
MSFSFRASVLALVIAALVRPAAAAESRSGTLELDPSKTLIEFRLPGALHTTHGNFKLVRGTIKADLATGEAGGSMVVDARSGESGIESRDDRMKNSVLEVQKYPDIIFAPRQVTGQLAKDGQFRAKLQGVLTLHGTRHEIAMDVEGRLIGDSLAAKSHFSVPYVEWGMEDPSILLLTVAKHVDIDIATAGRVLWTGERVRGDR